VKQRLLRGVVESWPLKSGFAFFGKILSPCKPRPTTMLLFSKWERLSGAKMDLPILGSADIFVSMKSLSKRQLVRNPSLASHLKPGQSLQLEDGKEPLVVSRRKRARLTAERIHAELDRLCEGAPGQDAQAALRDLRQ